jgi:hypothetical protein
MTNPFMERYKRVSDAELLEVLRKKHDYQPLAVEAARLELESRCLTAEELNAAKRVVFANNRQERRAKQQRKNQAYSFITSTVFVEEGASASKQVNRISLILVVAILYAAITAYPRFISYLDTPGNGWWAIWCAVPVLAFATATLLFWRGSDLGWRLLTVYAAFNLSLGLLVLLDLSLTPIVYSRGELLDNLLALTGFLFYMGMLWVICKQDIREVYGIDKRVMYRTIVFGGVMTILLIPVIHLAPR